MPALGHTVTIGAVDAAKTVLSMPEFRRAFGNVPIREDNAAAIPFDWWAAAAVDLVPLPGLTIAVDINRSPPGWSIAVAWPTDTGFHTDLVAYGAGMDLDEIPYRVRDLAERFGPAGIGLDPMGPAAALIPDFQALSRDRAIPLTLFNRAQRARADVSLFDLLRAGTLTHGSMPALDTAVEGAHSAERSGIWRFSRASSYVDISPLLAVSMAVWISKEAETLAPVFEIY
jgi:hypothetical protein